MSTNNSLWWSFDSGSNTFSALPAGPALLPALGLFALFAGVRALKGFTAPQNAGISSTLLNSDYYRETKVRQDYLIQKKIDGVMGISEGLTLAEQGELSDIFHPAWRNGGTWSF